MNKEWEDEEIANMERNVKHLKAASGTDRVVDILQQIVDIATRIKYERLEEEENGYPQENRLDLGI